MQRIVIEIKRIVIEFVGFHELKGIPDRAQPKPEIRIQSTKIRAETARPTNSEHAVRLHSPKVIE